MKNKTLLLFLLLLPEAMLDMHVMHLMYSHIDIFNNGNVIFKTFEVTITCEWFIISESKHTA